MYQPPPSRGGNPPSKGSAIDTTTVVDSVPYPLATADDLAETVRRVEALDRRIIAADADVRVDTTGRSIEDCLAEVLDALDASGYLPHPSGERAPGATT